MPSSSQPSASLSRPITSRNSFSSSCARHQNNMITPVKPGFHGNNIANGTAMTKGEQDMCSKPHDGERMTRQAVFLLSVGIGEGWAQLDMAFTCDYACSWCCLFLVPPMQQPPLYPHLELLRLPGLISEVNHRHLFFPEQCSSKTQRSASRYQKVFPRGSDAQALSSCLSGVGKQ